MLVQLLRLVFGLRNVFEVKHVKKNTFDLCIFNQEKYRFSFGVRRL